MFGTPSAHTLPYLYSVENRQNQQLLLQAYHLLSIQHYVRLNIYNQIYKQHVGVYFHTTLLRKKPLIIFIH